MSLHAPRLARARTSVPAEEPGRLKTRPTIPRTVQPRIRVPARHDSLPVLRAFVEGACRALAPHLPTDTVRELQLAVHEACTNIIRHAYGGESEQPLWLSARRDDDTLVFTTVDAGEPARRLLEAADEPPRTDWEPRESGYGVFLMRHLLDDISYRHEPRRGNVLTMRRHLPEKDANRR